MLVQLFHFNKFPVGVDNIEDKNDRIAAIREFRANFELPSWPYYSSVTGDPKYINAFDKFMTELSVFYYRDDVADMPGKNGKRMPINYPLLFQQEKDIKFPFNAFYSRCHVSSLQKGLKIIDWPLDQFNPASKHLANQLSKHPIMSDMKAWDEFNVDVQVDFITHEFIKYDKTNEHNFTTVEFSDSTGSFGQNPKKIVQKP